MKKFFNSLSSRRFIVGGYSMAAIAIVLAILIVCNSLVAALPSKYTSLDTSSNSLYTLSQETEQLLGNLDEEVELYWIVQSGLEDYTLSNLLDRYLSLSNKLSLTKRDPDVYPSFVRQYTDGTVYNNSLVAVSGERHRYVDYNELYQFSYNSDGTYKQSFAGEAALTSAIDFVVRDELPTMYLLTGHGESSLSSNYTSAVQRQNINILELSLLSLEAVPEEVELLLINKPQSDISSAEAEKLQTYLRCGGKLLLITDPPLEGRLENLEELMQPYGVSLSEGMLVEVDESNYAWGAPYSILPNMNSHSITAPLISGGYKVLLPISQGLKLSDEIPQGVSVTQLLQSSDEAFSKLEGYRLTSYDKTDGDIDGPFALAVAISAETQSDDNCQIVWFSSGAIVDDESNSLSSGGNQDLFLNAISWMCESEESITIHSKDMSFEYLSMSAAQASMLSALVVWIIPITFLAIGIFICIKRRRA